MTFKENITSNERQDPLEKKLDNEMDKINWNIKEWTNWNTLIRETHIDPKKTLDDFRTVNEYNNYANKFNNLALEDKHYAIQRIKHEHSMDWKQQRRNITIAKEYVNHEEVWLDNPIHCLKIGYKTENWERKYYQEISKSLENRLIIEQHMTNLKNLMNEWKLDSFWKELHEIQCCISEEIPKTKNISIKNDLIYREKRIKKIISSFEEKKDTIREFFSAYVNTWYLDEKNNPVEAKDSTQDIIKNSMQKACKDCGFGIHEGTWHHYIDDLVSWMSEDATYSMDITPKQAQKVLKRVNKHINIQKENKGNRGTNYDTDIMEHIQTADEYKAEQERKRHQRLQQRRDFDKLNKDDNLLENNVR